MAPDAIVHNSPALDSLKHQQLRSLCARHHVKSTGKRDALIKRLKALRNTASGETVDDEVDEPAGETEDSFDFMDEDPEELEGDHNGPLGVDAPRPSTSTARIQTDEFGALSMDAGTLTKSSSLKSIVSKLFGGSSSSNSTITASSSSGSISSLANTTLTRNTSNGLSVASSSNSTAVDLNQRQAKSSTGSVVDPIGPILSPRSCNPPSQATNKPAYRILDDSFANNTTVYNPDTSFVPRSSFDDDSVALANVPIWPPPPGLVLISPRQSPPRPRSVIAVGDVVSPPSAVSKRRYDDFSDGEDQGEESKLDDYFRTIRMIPKPPQTNNMLSPPPPRGIGEAPGTPTTSARKIARVPKRYSVLAASPPRFELEAPALPSLAGVMARMQEPTDTSKEEDVNLPGSFKVSTTRDTIGDASNAQKRILSPPTATFSPPTAAFTFGSPIQKAHVFSPPPASTSNSILAKQLEELQRRVGTSSTAAGPSNGGLKVSEDGRGILLPSTVSGEGSLFGNLLGKKTNSGVRFEDAHGKEESKMDSIANHWAAKRSSTLVPASKRTKTEDSSNLAYNADKLASTTSSSAAMSQQPSSASLTALNQQGRAAPMIPERPAPGPKVAKTSTQQAEDRKRIFEYGTAGSSMMSNEERARQTRRKSRGAIPGSTRKAGRVADPGQRRLPPSPTKVPLPSSSSANPANPVIPVKPRTISSSTSGFFKNSFNSLKSLTSNGSLSSKTTGSMGTYASGSVASTASTITHSASNGSLAQRPAGSYASSSLQRPTAASLARASSTTMPAIRHVTSSSNIPILSSPPKPDIAAVLQNLPSPPTNNPFDSQGKHKSPMLKSASNLASASPPKKRVSSISSAQRSSPLKSGPRDLNDSISEARKIRAKRDRQRSANVTLNIVEESSGMSARAGNGAGSGAARGGGGSLASRPAWR